MLLKHRVKKIVLKIANTPTGPGYDEFRPTLIRFVDSTLFDYIYTLAEQGPDVWQAHDMELLLDLYARKEFNRYSKNYKYLVSKFSESAYAAINDTIRVLRSV